MDEKHEVEQYFFDKSCLSTLSAFVSQWESPCVLCAPKLGERLVEQGHAVTILDLDDRFAHLPGFQSFDVRRPHWLGQKFDLILCDPPFFGVSLSQLFAAIRLLSRSDFSQPLMITYLKRRESAITSAFQPFGIEASGYNPSYQTVPACEKNEIEFFTNVPASRREGLRSG